MKRAFIKFQSDTDTPYQLRSGIIESEIGELDFSQSLRGMNFMFPRVRDTSSGNLSRFCKTDILIPAHKWYTKV